MTEVAIIGAGELGGSLAHVLARREIVSRIEIIDPAGQVAAGKALDIMQAGPVEGFCTVLRGSPDPGRMAGARIVVIADRAKPDATEDPLLALRQIAALAAHSVVLCANAGDRELVEAGVREARFRRERIFGSAPEALAASVRALVALRVDGSPRDVAVTVLGVPPAQTVIPWEDATVAGAPLTSVLDEPARRRLAAQIGPLWPPGPHALAHAAADAVAALCGHSRRTLSCFVSPDDSGGRRARAIAVPVRLGVAGIVRFEQLTLGVAARVALDTAAQL